MLVFERVAKQIEAQDENDSLLQKEVFQKARKKLKEKLVSRLGLSTVSSLITIKICSSESKTVFDSNSSPFFS